MKKISSATVSTINRLANTSVIKSSAIRSLSTNVKVNTTGATEAVAVANKETVTTISNFPRETAAPEQIKQFFDKSKAPSKRQPKAITDPKLFVQGIEEKLQRKLLLSRNDIDSIFVAPCEKPEDLTATIKLLYIYQRKGFDFEFRHCQSLVQHGLKLKEHEQLFKILVDPLHRIGAYLTTEILAQLIPEYLADKEHRLLHLYQSTVNRGLKIITRDQFSQLLSHYQTLTEGKEEKVKEVKDLAKRVLSAEEYQSLEKSFP